MGRYKSYPEYKNPGVDWVGNIPKHWSRGSIKHVLSQPITDGPHETPNFLTEGIEFLSVDGIQDGEIVFEGKRFISECDHLRYSLKAKPQFNDILVGKSASVGKVARVKTPKEFNVWSPLAILRSNPEKCSPEFLEYSLKSECAQRQIYLEGNTSTQANISMDRLGCIGITFPPIGEQTLIAARIDRETTRIDALIAKKTRFVELLKEKRQALITHAVTKGLNPNVKTKDSGVEWIGEVPEHWVTTKLGYLGRCKNGINIGGEAFGSGFPFFSYGDVYKNRVLPDPSGLVQSSESDRENYSLLRGDVLFTRTSETADEIGYSSACLQDVPNAVFAGFLIRFRPLEKKLYPDFSAYLFQNASLKEFFAKEMNIVTRASLSQDLLKGMPIMLPPLSEQEGIASFLKRKDLSFEKLVRSAEISIELLKERRSAFITAAVTGQIDLTETK